MANEAAAAPEQEAVEQDVVEQVEQDVVIPTPVAPRVQGRTQFRGLGRRKTSVARVYLRPGNGQWVVNGRTLEDYFPRAVLRQAAARPLAAVDVQGQFDIKCNVNGGGERGQAEAIRLGIARALLVVDPEYRPRLRSESLLTRDPREVERKKPGRPKARKRFQFSKR